jgi:SAM-dependent MidA family methyltransferase
MDYGTDHTVSNLFRICLFLSLLTNVFHHRLPQAFKGHALADPFDCPGQADLTANVDFVYLTEVLKGTGRPLVFPFFQKKKT